MKALVENILLLSMLSLVLISTSANSTVKSSQKYDFRVFLDEKEIGYHRFDIERENDTERVSIDANFDVKFLFVNVYSYKHQAEEVWTGQCLQKLDSKTKESGSDFYVTSTKTNVGLSIETQRGTDSLDGCVRSFAYWDVERLNVDRLLNSQTGKYVLAKLVDKGAAELEFEGRVYSTKLFVLNAEDANIQLYYGTDGQWLALKTKVKGGRILAYHNANMTKNKS